MLVLSEIKIRGWLAQNVYQIHSAKGQSTTSKSTKKYRLDFLFLHLLISPFVPAYFFLFFLYKCFTFPNCYAVLNFLAFGLCPSSDLPAALHCILCV